MKNLKNGKELICYHHKIDIIKLRKIIYNKIIFNRWFVCLIFQTAFSIFLLYGITIGEYSISSFIYLVLLNIFYSSFNLLTAVIFKSSSVGNFLIAGILYLFLRDDTQLFLSNFKVIQKVNFLLPILQNHNITISIGNFFSLILFITISVLLTNIMIKK